MGAAFLTTFFFALSALFATRSTRLAGVVGANFARQWFACALLALWAHTAGGGLGGAGLPTFLWSGIVGFGLGDLALYAAFPLIGSRLTALMVQCLAAPFAAVLEWHWLGTALDSREILCGSVILAGVALAVAPEKATTPAAQDDPAAHASNRQRTLGLLFGFIAALGQGGGAVLSRRANLLAQAAGHPVDGATAAYQRLLGGLLVVSLAYGAARWQRARAEAVSPGKYAPPDWRAAWPWIIANGLAGPVLGVSCYQWALATTPSALVLPIVALTPLVVIPFAYFMERERPGPRSLLGGAMAVAAAVALARARQP
jgi:drug/metabolite transporter (DMT)-like permease